MTRRVRVAPDAATEIDRIDEWWRQHRHKSPDLFIRELRAALSRIADLPSAGRPSKQSQIPNVRRVLLPKTRFYLYYRFSDAEVQVLVIWSARHDREPPL